MTIPRREVRLGRRWARRFAADMLERALAGYEEAAVEARRTLTPPPEWRESAWNRDGVDADGFGGVTVRMAHLRCEGVRALIAALRR